MKEKLALRWQACSARERTLLIAWGSAALLLLLWLAVVSPLAARIEQLEKRIPELETRLNAMRAQAPTAAPAKAASNAADLRSTLFRALGERKINGELRALSASRVELRLPELPMKDALDLLDFLRRETGARVVVLNANAAAGAASRLVLEFDRAP